MLTRRSFIRNASTTAATLVIPSRLALAQAFPTRAIRIVVPAGPGGPADIVARLATDALSSAGLSAIVEHRPGAAGAIAAREVGKAAPDGHTLLAGSTSVLAVQPLASLSAGYDPATAFAPIAKFMETHQVVVIPPTLPARTLAEFVTLAKAKPGSMSYGHTGAGGYPHLLIEVLRTRLGIDIVGVAFRSDGEIVTAVLSGVLHFALPAVGVAAQLINEKKLRALAVNSRRRSPLVPDIPTVEEAGVTEFDLTSLFGVVAPSGTPQVIIDRLSAIFNTHLAKPDTLAYLSRIGATADPGTPEAFAAYLASARIKWAKVIRDVGYKPK